MSSYWRNAVSLDRRSLAAWRVALGLMVVLDVLYRFKDGLEFYTDDGVLPRSLAMSLISAPMFSLYFANGERYFVVAMLCTQLLFGLAMSIGYCTRRATFGAWLLVCSLQARNLLIDNGGDIYLRILLFWALLAPVTSCYSVDQFLATCDDDYGESRDVVGQRSETSIIDDTSDDSSSSSSPSSSSSSLQSSSTSFTSIHVLESLSSAPRPSRWRTFLDAMTMRDSALVSPSSSSSSSSPSSTTNALAKTLSSHLVSSGATFGIVVQLFSVYRSSYLHKVPHAVWSETYDATFVVFRGQTIPRDWARLLVYVPTLLRVMTCVVFYMEGFALYAAFVPVWRNAALLIAWLSVFMLHFSIFISMRIEAFPIIGMTASLLLVPPVGDSINLSLLGN